MIGRIGRLIQRYAARKSQIVVLVPSRRRGSSDPVKAISSFLPSLCKRLSRCILIPTRPPHFVDTLPANEGRGTKRVVLFAHPADSLLGFEANNLTLSGDDCLTAEWWRRPGRHFEMLVAHVCQGQKVLEHMSWRDVFPNWVSYRDSIDAFLSSEHDKKIWAEIGVDIVEATTESRTAEHLTNRIRSAYILKIAEIGDFNNPRDVIHVIHFQNAMERLVFSQDEKKWEQS
jgi:hypothetical protein